MLRLPAALMCAVLTPHVYAHALHWADVPRAAALGRYDVPRAARHGYSTDRARRVQRLQSCNPFVGVRYDQALTACN